MGWGRADPWEKQEWIVAGGGEGADYSGAGTHTPPRYHRWIQSPMPSLVGLPQAPWICISDFAGTDMRSPIGVADARQPQPQPHSLAFLSQCGFRLGCPYHIWSLNNQQELGHFEHLTSFKKEQDKTTRKQWYPKDKNCFWVKCISGTFSPLVQNQRAV